MDARVWQTIIIIIIICVDSLRITLYQMYIKSQLCSTHWNAWHGPCGRMRFTILRLTLHKNDENRCVLCAQAVSGKQYILNLSVIPSSAWHGMEWNGMAWNGITADVLHFRQTKLQNTCTQPKCTCTTTICGPEAMKWTMILRGRYHHYDNAITGY